MVASCQTITFRRLPFDRRALVPATNAARRYASCRGRLERKKRMASFDNPIGLDGFEFIEFSASGKGVLEPVFVAMGFTLIARHRSKDVQLWRQGGINLIANYEPRSPAAYFAAEHGPSAC